jgi:predicted transcriptional regulator
LEAKGMRNFKTGITAGEVMNRNFAIVDSSLLLIDCVRKIKKKQEACLVIKNGYFSGVLGQDEILRGFVYGKDKAAKIDKIRIGRNYVVVPPDSDIYETISLMNDSNVDFAVVKRKDRYIGLITKKEIADVEPLLFEEIVFS